MTSPTVPARAPASEAAIRPTTSGRRIAAWLVDLAIVAALVGVVYLSGLIRIRGCDTFNPDTGTFGASCPFEQTAERERDDGSIEVVYVLESGRELSVDHPTVKTVLLGTRVVDPPGTGTYLVGLGYVLAVFVLIQGLTGKTPGKAVTGIRLARDDGSAPGVPAALLRWLVVDGAIGLFGVLMGLVDGPWPLRLLAVDAAVILLGGVAALTSAQGHPGDLLAHTYVIDDAEAARARRRAQERGSQPLSARSDAGMPPTAEESAPADQPPATATAPGASAAAAAAGATAASAAAAEREPFPDSAEVSPEASPEASAEPSPDAAPEGQTGSEPARPAAAAAAIPMPPVGRAWPADDDQSAAAPDAVDEEGRTPVGAEALSEPAGDTATEVEDAGPGPVSSSIPAPPARPAAEDRGRWGSRPAEPVPAGDVEAEPEDTDPFAASDEASTRGLWETTLADEPSAGDDAAEPAEDGAVEEADEEVVGVPSDEADEAEEAAATAEEAEGAEEPEDETGASTAAATGDGAEVEADEEAAGTAELEPEAESGPEQAEGDADTGEEAAAEAAPLAAEASGSGPHAAAATAGATAAGRQQQPFWDEARRAYIFWDSRRQEWLEFDYDNQRWGPISRA